MSMAVVPYKQNTETKKEQVAMMFNNISKKYDLLNHVLSLGIDVQWRKKAIRLLRPEQPQFILDIATGTGDFALEASTLKPQKIIGVDISDGMLTVGKEKISRKGLENVIQLELGDSENLDFNDNKFDAVIVAFGVRNFENLKKGLTEMCRVTRKGGQVVIIEFSKPTKFPVKQVYNLYFQNVLPWIGKLVSRDSSAYTYLPESVSAFPYGDKFLAILESAGYSDAKCIPLTFGISSIYWAKK